MKWRKLIELSTSSSPPKSAVRIGRQARFETLENRKLFAADLAEVSVVDDSAVEIAEFKSVDADASIEPEIWTFDVADPAIRMMTFRGAGAGDGQVKSEEIFDESELGSPIMYMTGAVGGLEDLDVRTLEADVDLSATSYLVDDTAVVDDVIADEDLIFYSLGADAEVETTSVEETLTAEDVNGDGNVTALDMLLVINALNSYGALPSSQLIELPEVASTAGNWDINRDGYVTPLDALLLTNFFNNGGVVATVESSQADQLVAPMVARIRQPVDDELGSEVSDSDAPLVDELT